ncbi:MAG TPA: YdaU family protein [Terriglobales bacterium]|nr:YdaU family protein [Terriglobales bacterium]
MNYYEHHIGDYDEATSHLTACEDGIYCRLIRKYMAKEQPLPDDLPALQRLVRARTREEKNAVASILTEFFYLRDGFWHQKTCDEVIEKFHAGKPEREVKKANEDNRLKKHREERSALFRALTEVGEHAPWNTPMGELREMVKRVTATAPETLSQPLPATAPATPATATQTPIPNTQYPDIKPLGGGTDVGGIPRATVRPAELSAAMRRHSIEAQPGDPRIIAAAAAGITPETVEAACAEAKSSDPTGRVKPGFVLSIAERWTREARSPRATGKPAAVPRSYHDERADVIAQLTGRKAAHQNEDDGVIDVHAHAVPRLGS